MTIQDVPQTGKIGKMVSYMRGSRVCRRAYVVPKDPRTPCQCNRREVMKQMRALWNALTEKQRVAWIDAGKSRRTRRRLNQSGTLPGYQLFIKINCNLASVGLPPVLDPPAAPDFPENAVEKLVVTGTDGEIAIQVRVSGKPVPYVVVRAAKPCSAGTTYVDHFTIIGVLPEPEGKLCDIKDLFVAKYGEPPPGSRIFIEVIQQIDGWQSLPRRFTALVPVP